MDPHHEGSGKGCRRDHAATPPPVAITLETRERQTKELTDATPYPLSLRKTT